MIWFSGQNWRIGNRKWKKWWIFQSKFLDFLRFLKCVIFHKILSCNYNDAKPPVGCRRGEHLAKDWKGNIIGFTLSRLKSKLSTRKARAHDKRTPVHYYLIARAPWKFITAEIWWEAQKNRKSGQKVRNTELEQSLDLFIQAWL